MKGQEKKEFLSRIIENKDILDRVVTICDADMKKSRNIQIDRDSFRLPEWSSVVAYEFGYQKALEDVINLLTLRGKND